MRMLLAVLFIAAFGSPAFAKIQFCNKFKHPVTSRLLISRAPNG
jgi:hypothetical protein